MSITRVTPGLGTWVKCDGTEQNICNERRFTANVVPKHNRAHWKKEEGWGRGARSLTRSWDLCPKHLKHEQDLVAQIKADKAAAKKLNAAKQIAKETKRLAKLAAKSSPSAASAPAPSTSSSPA